MWRGLIVIPSAKRKKVPHCRTSDELIIHDIRKTVLGAMRFVPQSFVNGHWFRNARTNVPLSKSPFLGSWKFAELEVPASYTCLFFLSLLQMSQLFDRSSSMRPVLMNDTVIKLPLQLSRYFQRWNRWSGQSRKTIKNAWLSNPWRVWNSSGEERERTDPYALTTCT